MARKLDDILAELPEERLARVEDRFMKLAALEDLRLAARLGIVQRFPRIR